MPCIWRLSRCSSLIEASADTKEIGESEDMTAAVSQSIGAGVRGVKGTGVETMGTLTMVGRAYFKSTRIMLLVKDTAALKSEIKWKTLDNRGPLSWKFATSKGERIRTPGVMEPFLLGLAMGETNAVKEVGRLVG